jgi:glutathione S-transferase
MKLYFTPGACSLSPHIVLHEAGLPFEAETVDLKSKKTGSGADFTTVNPKGAVPALQLDNGEVLTEGVAIVQYLADQKPETGLAPQNGTLPRYRLQEWLNFVSTELHKGFSPLFNPALPDDMKEITKQGLAKKLAHLEGCLDARPPWHLR